MEVGEASGGVELAVRRTISGGSMWKKERAEEGEGI